MAKNDEEVQNLKGIRCKLSRDNLKKIKNIHNKRMKGESEIGMKTSCT